MLIQLVRQYLKWRGVNDWFPAYPTGTIIHVLDPSPEVLDIRDVVHALSHINRFGGHTRQPYSVGQHSLHVYNVVHGLVALSTEAKLRRTALLHDGPEAYLNDIIRPLKNCLPVYRAIEELWWNCFAERWALFERIPPLVKQADDIALVSERQALCVPNSKVRPWRQDGQRIEPRSIDRWLDMCPSDVRDIMLKTCYQENIR